jgi:hypothetical protein
MMHRRTAVGVPAFVAAIVVTAVVVATAIFAAAPFSTTVTKTVPEISTSVQTTTPTQLSTQTTTVTVTSTYPTTSSETSQTSLSTNFTTSVYYFVSINYTGSWNLVYWGQNGTYGSQEQTIPGTTYPYNTERNLNGSGNYQTTITAYIVGYSENTLCAKATKLDSQNLTLNLTVVDRTNSTTASNPSAEVCATYGV